MKAFGQQQRPLRVCYPFVGNNVGGSHLSTLLLVKNLTRSSVEPLIVIHEEGLLADYIVKQGLSYELVEIPRFFSPPYWSQRNVSALLTRTRQLAAFLKNRKIDIVHANDVRIHLGWTLATKLAGAKLIWHQRTGTFGKSLPKLLLAKLSEQVVCISRYTASTLPQSLAPRIRIVPNPFETSFAGIDRGKEKARVLNELSLPSDTHVIGFFGNLVQQKRPEVFLRAASIMKQRLPCPLAFLMFGAERNNSKALLQELAGDLGLGDRVFFMGFQTPVEPWMAGCDLIIAPGIGDGLGRSLVEGMICGAPVVAADSGGHREVIEDGKTGLLAAADDPIAFADAAERILSDPALAAGIAERGRTAAIQGYSIERHVDEMTKIYLGSFADRHNGLRTHPENKQRSGAHLAE